MLFYSIPDVGKYVRILAFLIPIMYLDSITDGMLRGLGQHMYTMWVNISDSLVSVIIVYVLLPKWAVAGYLFMICFTEVVNFAMSIYRLSKFSNISFPFVIMVKALFSALASVNISMLILRTIGIPLSSTALSVAAHIILSLASYFVLLRMFCCIDQTDINMLRSIFKKRAF